MNPKLWVLTGAGALVLGVAMLAPDTDLQAGISQSPLTLGTKTKPNVMLVVDNSGSMDGEGLYLTNDGALWWNTATKTIWGMTANRGQRGLNYNETGDANKTWKKYTYLFPSAGRVYADDQHGHFALPPTIQFAFARSPDYNGQYYDPKMAAYPRWPNGGGYTFADATPSAVKLDPISGTKTIDLTRDITESFRLHPGMHKKYGGTPMVDSELANKGEFVGDNYPFTYSPAIYYLRTSTGSYTAGGTTYDCAAAAKDPAGYQAFVTNPDNANIPAGLAIAPDGWCLQRHVITDAAELKNFANWFQYHRKRHLALRAGMGVAFDKVGGIRAGGTPINGMPSSIAMFDFDEQRDKVYKFFYDIGANSSGTPNRQALAFAGAQYDNKELGIVQHVCQRNYFLQFTDGFSVPDTSSAAGNADANKGSPYADGYSNTIADIAMKYYTRVRGGANDLAGGSVPVPDSCKNGTAEPWVDCNKDPHVNYYGITLGAQGDKFGVKYNSVEDAYAAPPQWVDPVTARHPMQIDDLYHAAVNGRGEMFNAKSSTQLGVSLKEALDSITANAKGSGSRTAASSTRAGGGSQLFHASFDGAQWTGDLKAFTVNALGNIAQDKPDWSASAKMPAHGARKILFNKAGALTDFKWDKLSAAQQEGFNRDPRNPVAADNLGEKRVNWLRGDPAMQKRGGGVLRDRASALGDIVNSSPRYVGRENYAFERLPKGAAGRDTYQAFRFKKAARTPMVYVGANDGMLHAFDASVAKVYGDPMPEDAGKEKWAFVPTEFINPGASELIPALSYVPRTDYMHRYYVDGQPVSGDVYFDSDKEWHTILVTPMGAGGTGIVAFDVTKPEAPKLLWEYKHAELGHVIGQTSIQRMHNNAWGVIVGSGYGVPGKSAKLFIIDAQTGTLTKLIDTDPAGTTANGLSAPYPVDTNGDAIVDMVYAGDLWGNLWRFDVIGDLSKWAVHHQRGDKPAPLFSACAGGDVTGLYDCTTGRQPITMRPVVGRAAGGGQMVYFGTGKFFEDGDNSVPVGGAVQSFYGVIDDNNVAGAPLAGRSELQAQTIVAETDADNDPNTKGANVRVTSSTPLGTKKGWYLNLLYTTFNGERAVADPILQGGRIIFTTLIPGDVCSGDSDGWLMELDARDGSRFEHPVLDLNGDGRFTPSSPGVPGDTVDHGGTQTAASGVRSTIGALQTPSIFNTDSGTQQKHLSGTSGKLQQVGELDTVAHGRTSWRQLWP